MAEKLNLRKLLQEEQQPFVLNEYISDFQNQLKIHIPKRTHSLNPKPISKNSNFPLNFYKNPCFFSLNQSPVSTRSPLFSFQSPAKSPKPVFFQIPSKTASHLLQSAFRIQKSSSSYKSKSRKSGLLGSILKSLTHRKNNQIEAKTMQGAGDLETDISGRAESAVWSVSNGEKSLVTSSTTQSEVSDEFESQFFKSQDFDFFENPIDFVLQTSAYPCRRTPVFFSPTTSPSRHKSEDREGSKIESLKKFQVEEVDEREEEKDQCSPVSVLDSLFPDEDEDEYEHESSHPFLKRSKQQLLLNLRRFENIADFNPLEFENKMLQHEQDDQKNECEFTDDFGSSNNKSNNNIIQKVLESDFHSQACVPEGMKRLVRDLIDEEESKQDHHVFGRDTLLAKRVSERFDLWKDVKLDTIDMMVEQDMKSELDEWRGRKEQVHETVLEIQVFVLGLLLKELVF